MKICAFEWESVCGTDLDFKSLEKYADISYFEKPCKEDLPRLMGDAEGIILSKIQVDAELLDACPNLKYIGVTATGYNNIDIAACKKRGVTVTNIPDYSADAVCQMTFAFILQFAQSLVSYLKSTEQGDWVKAKNFCYYPYPLTELKGKTLGLVGMGSIGEKVATVGEAFGMKVIYHTRNKKETEREYVSLEELYSRSDFVSLHLPLSSQTEKMINRDTLGKMKKSAFLINTARGGLVDEEDLRDALNEGVIAGYGADVLTFEPQREDCPLLSAKNCILTPHVAWAPKETRARLISILKENLVAYLEGREENVVTK